MLLLTEPGRLFRFDGDMDEYSEIIGTMHAIRSFRKKDGLTGLLPSANWANFFRSPLRELNDSIECCSKNTSLGDLFPLVIKLQGICLSGDDLLR